MYVHSVKLINYKSIGAGAESEVILEPRVTAIIGKNESGKSNVLEGLSRVRFTVRNQDAFKEDTVNRNCPSGTENEYVVVLKPSDADKSSGIAEDTTVKITKGACEATGGVVTYCSTEIRPCIDQLLAVLDKPGFNPLKLSDSDLASYRVYYQEICSDEKIDIPRRTAAFAFIQSHAERIAVEHRENLKFTIDSIQSKWTAFIKRIPVLFYRRMDKHLNAIYKYEDIGKELKSPQVYPNSLLSDFVKILGISNEDFLTASRSGISSQQENVRRKINRLVDEKINSKFKEFYKTEEIFLDLGFNGGVVSFVVQSNNGSALMLSERSNGLRWYLEIFIDALAHNITERKVVYLLDEPGTSLHVNAQREVLKFFKYLADQGNQVVYTTHSPYMLDLEDDGIHRIRAVTKDDEGVTRIFKTAYDARIAPGSQKDTLAPIISALGMNLQDTFGPAKDRVNIVTEGMSDYIYLSTMAKQLGIDPHKYAIQPAVGASNCINLCQILHGWGCKYVALFDYDKAGVESGGEYMRKEMLFECGRQYCYTKEVSQEDISLKSYNTDPYMIEDVVLRSEIDRFCEITGTAKNLGKPLTAKLMCDAIENHTFALSEVAVNNFKQLFNRVLSCGDSG